MKRLNPFYGTTDIHIIYELLKEKLKTLLLQESSLLQKQFLLESLYVKE